MEDSPFVLPNNPMAATFADASVCAGLLDMPAVSSQQRLAHLGALQLCPGDCTKPTP